MILDESFRYKTITYSVDSVIAGLRRGQIVVDSDFKYSKPWTLRDRSLFIESALLSIPTQPIWCEESKTGQFVVIDGSERLRSLLDYTENKYKLTGLRIKWEYNNRGIDTLPYFEVMSLGARYTLQFMVIDYDTSPDLKREFYKRINKNERGFQVQAARNFAYRDALSLLRTLEAASEPYISFESEKRSKYEDYYIGGRKEEIFLRMMHFAEILKGVRFNVPMDFTVDDDLDRLMRSINQDCLNGGIGNIYHPYYMATLFNLQALNNYYSGTIHVELGKNIKNPESFYISEFYQYFIRGLVNKFTPPPSRVVPIGWWSSHNKVLNLLEHVKRIIND